MEDVIVPVFVCGILFIGLPWLIMHYVTKWKQAPGAMTTEDEQLLDELHSLARRLEDRVNTVERLVAADNPDFRPGLTDYARDRDYRLEDQHQRRN
ncbi:envelope stress response membrane protein PspB [uncultured Sphingomonas sp.]|uniref:envelope stress response membrane protein PspB n=1 Tax=uncultured Sphingomonas sp. TaxID=158754 RepID=UPI00261B3E4E|nr:envelope stress response membrane protein PspB [uncultured Sphingomonas sp.]